MKKLILHIGASKCASSSIQHYLGQKFSAVNGIQNEDGDCLKYLCLFGNGEILYGERLLKEQKQNMYEYLPSADFNLLSSKLLEGLENIRQILNKDDVAILSCEAWAAGLNDEVKGALETFGVPVDVFFVVRPPVDWINSAWWQWGAWSDTTLEDWIKGGIKAVNFYQQYEDWKSISVVREIKVTDSSQSPVTSFQKFLKVELEDTKIINQGTHPALLEHILDNRDMYSRTQHYAAAEFYLNSLLQLPPSKSPFVIPKESCAHIISYSKEANSELIKAIENSTGKLDLSVIKRYIDEDSYSNASVRDLSEISSHEEKKMLIDHLMKLVLYLSRRDAQ